jgi:hypothetical protein
MKFRTPELFLGAFLAVAIFAMGILFASSQKPSSPAQQVSSTKAAGQSDQTKAPDADLTGSTWLTKDAAGFFTFALVWVGGIQAWFFWVQLRLIRTSLVDAKTAAGAAERAAKATEDAVELSRTTAQMQLRAYIVADAVDVDITHLNGPQGEVMVSVKIAIKNTGQTPAHDLRVVSKTELLRHPIEMPFDFTLISGPNPSSSALGPGEHTASESKPDAPFDGNAMMVATEPESCGRIYTWGTVTYRDVFGGNQWTNFCSSLIFTESEAITHASEYHNDAS